MRTLGGIIITGNHPSSLTTGRVGKITWILENSEGIEWDFRSCFISDVEILGIFFSLQHQITESIVLGFGFEQFPTIEEKEGEKPTEFHKPHWFPPRPKPPSVRYTMMVVA